MNLPRLRNFSLITGLAAAAACAAFLFAHTDAALFFRAYLFSFLFCLGLALGGLCLLMLHNLTGGEWGERIGPFTHAAAGTLPLVALFFIPICFGLPQLFSWAAAEAHADALLVHRIPYLNAPFFYIRAALYFIIWILLAALLRRPSATMSRRLSAGGLVLYLFTMTHAGIDWIMSRDTDFYSTAFGFVITVGQTLAALAFCIILAARLQPAAPQAPIQRPRPHRLSPALLLNDLGNLLLTLVILWAYVSFMQFLVIWMGNTREDNSWYLARGLAGDDASPAALAWRLIGGAILLGQFFIPFYTMLFRKAKQNSSALTAAAIIVLVTHVLEMYWLVAPSGHGSQPRFDPHWLDLLALLALTGLWLSAFFFILQRRPAVQPPPVEGVPAHD